MKKKIASSLLSVCLCMFMLTMVACGTHDHTYSAEWSYNEAYHWHKCTGDGCNEVKDKAKHSYIDGVCVCGKTEPQQPHEHTYATEWTTDDTYHWKIATCEHTDLTASFGNHTFDENNKCSICGYEKEILTPSHEHTFSIEWEKNEISHWHKATCEHTDLTASFGNHTFDENNKCSICGYEKEILTPSHEHTFSIEWEKNEISHWHKATCEHIELTSNLERHNFVNNKCSVCNYEREEPGHVHTFQSEYSYNESYHYYRATCGHDIYSNLEEHTFDADGYCIICNYFHEHVYGEWTILRYPSEFEPGERTHRCTICDREENDPLFVEQKLTFKFNEYKDENANYHIVWNDESNYFPSITTELDLNDYVELNNGGSFITIDKNIGDNKDTICLHNVIKLKSGHNYFTVVFIKDYGNNEIYNLDIYVKHSYKVTFEDLEPIYIDEGELVTLPSTTPKKVGYIFKNWDFDFDTRIYEDTYIEAIYDSSTDIDYTVRHYLKNANDDEYSLVLSDTHHNGVNGELTKGNSLDLSLPEYSYYILDEEKSITEITIDALTDNYIDFYYNRKTYLISVNDNKLGAINNMEEGQYPYGINMTLTAKPFINAIYNGMYYYEDITDKHLLTKELSYVFDDSDIFEYNILIEYIKDESFEFDIEVIDDEVILKSYLGESTDVVIPSGITTIDKYVFSNSNITSIYIGSDITKIGESAFMDCHSLKKVTFLASVTQISDDCFRRCYVLESFIMPDSVSEVGICAFRDCTSLESLELSDSLTTINSYAFSNCEKFTTLTIPSSVTTIGLYAFANCTNLITVYNYSSAVVDSTVFKDCPNLTLE